MLRSVNLISLPINIKSRDSRSFCLPTTTSLQDRGTDGSSLDRGLDSRVADVDPREDLVEVFSGPAVEAAVVRQQVVELLQRHLEARHVRALRHLLAPLVLHLVGFMVADGCHFTVPWLVGSSCSQWSKQLFLERQFFSFFF